MSTILDALRKLQRERAAQGSAKDLRGSITHESGRARRRGTGARNFGILLALLALAGGGYLSYRSGRLQGLLARFSSGGDDIATDEDFAAVEREGAEREAAAAAQQGMAQADTPSVAESPPAAAPVARLPRTPRSAPQQPVADAPAESPEILAERARLEAALANARAAQEAQRQAELDAQAAQQAAARSAPPSEPAIDSAPTPAPAAMAPVPPPTQGRVVAKRPPPPPDQTAAPVAKAAPAQPTPRAKPETRDAEPEARAMPRAVDDAMPAHAAFPDVRVESIRWHPIAERRVASLRFERQNAPEAREGDIVAGVLVYRIDPGSVELRVGGVQRTVLPGP